MRRVTTHHFLMRNPVSAQLDSNPLESFLFFFFLFQDSYSSLYLFVLLITRFSQLSLSFLSSIDNSMVPYFRIFFFLMKKLFFYSLPLGEISLPSASTGCWRTRAKISQRGRENIVKNSSYGNYCGKYFSGKNCKRNVFLP